MDGLIAYALSKKYVDGKTSSLATGMSWKGTKENVSSLPQSGNQVGDLWHVNEDGNEYAWDGSKWEALGGISLTPEQIEAVIEDYFEEYPNVSKIPRVTMTSADTTAILNPNKLYVFPEMATLTLTFVTPTDNTIVNEYHFIFESGATATTTTFPAIPGLNDFAADSNMVYEISVLEGRALVVSWEASSE